MCFNWSEQANADQPDALEYLDHRLGPILAPWILRDATHRAYLEYDGSGSV